MKKTNYKNFIVSGIFLLIFVLWTILVRFVNVKPIGPKNSFVGFASLNSFFHNFTGVHIQLYYVTDWLSLVPVCVITGFALLGLFQLIKRRNIFKVDFEILVLGGFYIAVMFFYVFFEIFVINYRPILINGILEASYPSSTTLLVLCVMPSAIILLNNYVKNIKVKTFAKIIIIIFTVFMVISRLISGVHWLTDIIGGILLSVGLVMTFHSFCKLKKDL